MGKDKGHLKGYTFEKDIRIRMRVGIFFIKQLFCVTLIFIHIHDLILMFTIISLQENNCVKANVPTEP